MKPTPGSTRRPNAACLKVVEEGFADVREAASYLRVGRNWIYALCRCGAITYMRHNNRILIPWAALREYAAARLRPGSVA